MARDVSKREKTVSILDQLLWSVQPKQGIVKGDYYIAESRFGMGFEEDPGHLGTLEVVRKDGRLVMVEFNEVCSPTYYMRMQQNLSKRLSNYGFFQASKERTATTGVVLVNGLTHLEEQMVEQNRLTGDFDLLCGASNSINRCMLPLAREIADKLDTPSGQLYYGIAQTVEPGVTGRLQVILQSSGNRIVRCFYDEIFADHPEDIDDPELKPYYRQSKYHAPEYVSTIGTGFNAFSDLLDRHVRREQSLTRLPAMPFTQPPNPAREWAHYLRLAAALEEELGADHRLPG